MAINSLIGLMGRPVQPIDVARPRLQNAQATLMEEQAARARQQQAEEQATMQALGQAMGSPGGMSPENVAKIARVNPKAAMAIQGIASKQQADQLAVDEAKLKNRETEVKTAGDEFKQYQEKAGAWSNVATGILRNAEKLQDPKQKADAVVQGLWQAASDRLIDGPRAYEMYQFIQNNGYTPQVEQMLRAVQANGIKPADQLKMDFEAEQAARAAAMGKPQLDKATADAQIAQQQAAGTTPITPYQQAQLEKTDDITEYKLAVKEGFKGSFPDWTRQQANLKAPRSTTTITNTVVDPTKMAQLEATLRDDFRKDTSSFSQVAKGYSQIKAAREGSPVSDIALMYGYMKILDPTSVVREGEYATAQNAGGIPARIWNAYNNLIGGGKLSPEVRKQFIQQAEDVYRSAESDYKQTEDQYRQIVKSNGLREGNVLINTRSTAGKPVQPPVNPAVPLDDLAKKFGGRKVGQ